MSVILASLACTTSSQELDRPQLTSPKPQVPLNTRPQPTVNEHIPPPNAPIKVAEAVAFARNDLRRHDIDPAGYTVSTLREPDGWIVRFLHAPPRPPGGLVTVVGGLDGTIREFYLGE